MRVKLLLSGGGLPAFGYYKPVTVTQPSGTTAAQASAAASSASSSNKSSELGAKDLLSMVDKLDALPSDVSSLKGLLMTTFSSNSSSLFGGSLDTGVLANQFTSALLAIKDANFSKKQIDEVKKTLNQNGGLNEVAITNQGGVIVADKSGKITQVSADEYLHNRGKYLAITNSKLLYMRTYDPNFSGNDSMIEVASNGIGLQEVNKYIKSYLGHLGTSTSDRTSYQVLKGAEAIQKVYLETGQIKLEGLYSTKVLTSDLKKLAQLALTYIWNMLPDNAKTLLKVKSGSEDNAKELIASYVGSGLTDKNTYSEKYELDAEGNRPGTKKEEKEKKEDALKYKSGAASMFVAGRGQKTQFVIQNGTADGIRVSATSLPITNATKGVLGPSSLEKVQSGGFGGILDWQNVTIGGQKISEANLSKVACTDGRIYSIDFPIDIEEYSRGNIVPDFQMFSVKEEADRELSQQGIDVNNPSADQIEAINTLYEQKGIPAKYNSDGSIKSDVWARFGVMNGVAISTAFDEDVTFSDLLPEVDDEKIDGYLHIFNKSAGLTSTQEEIKGKDVEFSRENWWDKLTGFGGQHWWSTHDTMHEGTIFIPVIEDEMSAIIGDKNYTTAGETQTIDEMQQDTQLENEYNEEGLLDE